MQATHLLSPALFTTIHVSHSHEPSLFLNLSPNPAEAAGADGALAAESEGGMVSECLRPVPGLAVSHATHLVASALLETRHVSHSQVPADLANMVPKPVVVAADALLLPLLSSPVEAAALLSGGFVDGEAGLAVVQQTHLLSDGLFCTKHTSQLQPAGALNKPENPGVEAVEVEEAAAAVVAVLDEENEKEGAVVFCGASGVAEV